VSHHPEVCASRQPDPGVLGQRPALFKGAARSTTQPPRASHRARGFAADLPMALIEQEFSPLPEIEIPGEVRDIYKLWRPTPLLSRAPPRKSAPTPARIYYKYEGVSPAGSHKPNTASRRPITTSRRASSGWPRDWRGAVGQRPVAGREHVRPRVHVLHGAGQLRSEALPPHDDERLGRGGLRQPSRTHSREGGSGGASGFAGSLGIAISEAVEDAATHGIPTIRWAAC